MPPGRQQIIPPVHLGVVKQMVETDDLEAVKCDGLIVESQG
jgi:hypothetical protein